MTEDRLPLAELLAKAGDGDFLRAVAEAVMQLLMEADVEGMIGAGRHERTPERATYRNGYRDRSLDTRLGSLQLRILKLRPKASAGQLLPAVPRAEEAFGEGSGGSHPGSLDRGRFYPARRRSGAGPSRACWPCLFQRSDERPPGLSWDCRGLARARCRSSARTSTPGSPRRPAALGWGARRRLSRPSN